MKIVFTVIPLAERKFRKGPFYYKSTEDLSIDYKKEVMFPVTSLVGSIAEKGEDIKIIMLMNDSQICTDNADDLEKEISSVCKSIGANAIFERKPNQFKESRKAHEERLQEILGTLTDDMEIYADITFGQKTQSWILQSVFRFAEKFYDAEVHNIVYGKVDLHPDVASGTSKEETDRIIADSAELCDVTSLYYLANLTSTIESSSAEKALEVVKGFFAE